MDPGLGPVVRFGHWILVAAFFTAYLTEGEVMPLHAWAGYIVAGIVALRLLWGLVGTRYARFSDFVRSPVTVLRYLRNELAGRTRRYLGHNPAGGAMIVALLVCLTVTVGSGMALYAYEDGAGPLASVLVTSSPAGVSGEDLHERYEEAEEVWEEVHEVFANLTLLLIVLHVVGVVVSSLAHRENLIRAMITGRKRADAA